MADKDELQQPQHAQEVQEVSSDLTQLLLNVPQETIDELIQQREGHPETLSKEGVTALRTVLSPLFQAQVSTIRKIAKSMPKFPNILQGILTAYENRPAEFETLSDEKLLQDFAGHVTPEILTHCLELDDTTGAIAENWNTMPVEEKAHFLADEITFPQYLRIFKATNENADKIAPLQQITYSNSEKLKTSTDKLTNEFFSALGMPNRKYTDDGQLSYTEIPYTKTQKGKTKKLSIPLLYTFDHDMDALKQMNLPANFGNDFEFFVTAIMDNLHREGNDLVSLSKVYHEVYGTKNSPSVEGITEIANALRKGIATTVYINDKQVQEAWGNRSENETYNEIVSPAIPVQFVSERFMANGKTASGKVLINGYSPFYMLAKSIDHRTSWDKDVLRLYTGRRTKRYFRILRYLMGQIGWMRNDNSKRRNKMLFKTIYEQTGEKKSRDKQLAKQMVYRLLDEVFIPLGYVKAYKEDEKTDAVWLDVVPEKKRIAQNKA